MTIALLDETRALDVDGRVASDGIRLAPDVVRDALGWELKPQGLCRGDACVPIPSESRLVRDDAVDLGALASLLGRPLALDVAERAACLGAAAGERAHRLASLDAPDFTLPDLDGAPRALSGFRGTKVLLVAWASW